MRYRGGYSEERGRERHSWFQKHNKKIREPCACTSNTGMRSASVYVETRLVGPFSEISIIRKDVKLRKPSSDTQSCDVVVGVETHHGKTHSSQSLISVDMTNRRRTNQIFMNGNRQYRYSYLLNGSSCNEEQNY